MMFPNDCCPTAEACVCMDKSEPDKLLSAAEVERVIEHYRDKGEGAASMDRLGRFQYRLLYAMLKDISALPDATPSPAEVERLRGDWKFINSAVDHWSEGIAEAEEAMEIIRDRVLKRRAVLHPQEKPE